MKKRKIVKRQKGVFIMKAIYIFYRYCTGFKGLADEGDDRNEESTHTHAELAPHTHTGTGIDPVSVDSMATAKVCERRMED